MPAFITLLSPLGIIAIIFLFFILGRLSEKLGAVTKMPSHYRWFWVGMGFVSIALISHLLRISELFSEQASQSWLDLPIFYLITYHLPMAMGVTIGLVVTWHYWSWLLTETDG